MRKAGFEVIMGLVYVIVFMVGCLIVALIFGAVGWWPEGWRF